MRRMICAPKVFLGSIIFGTFRAKLKCQATTIGPPVPFNKGACRWPQAAALDACCVNNHLTLPRSRRLRTSSHCRPATTCFSLLSVDVKSHVTCFEVVGLRPTKVKDAVSSLRSNMGICFLLIKAAVFWKRKRFPVLSYNFMAWTAEGCSSI